ncbi:HsdR family type I site-specific deoxyribonuclease [Nocardia beijingensis]|uniref:type I restriction endonuclease subunit R n=1 Tax=Nocardia beijingensis TaxID=95162 RepID=UPI001895FC4D|nr:HsdR family type I site-specific deoxyribonuclease [Nocardia beijingensis]MBF6469947.1 HsdR family type I site-specific deoxyribonuclease [Nocardia beijingensis]
MSNVGESERETQDRIAELFRSQLHYDYLGHWAHRADNSNIERQFLIKNLKERGYDDNLIKRAIGQLVKAAAVGPGHDLHEANKEVYSLLRYGVKVKPGVSEKTKTVWLIDWETPKDNDFAIAEEVTVAGQHTKRPDIVLYVNGLALGTLELKRSKVAVSEGIRQTISNQDKQFIRPFFSTVQFVFAGNNSEGLKYGVIDTPEKYWMEWKENSLADVDRLDRALLQMCTKDRFLELIHDFIVFDRGVKKGPRHNQYFGVKAAQERIAKREGGIIWHTQGSGKSLTMVWLAKWIRENQSNDPRVLLITDRTELDQQIAGVFEGVNEKIYRTKSSADLISTLNTSQESLICTLIHKFRNGKAKKDDAATADFIKELNARIPKDFKAKGDFFVFVDEAHRTQSGAMHDAMKELLPNAMFIGFTGTPLLKDDKKTTIEKFGTFIHTYKFDEAVSDKVVLDLQYEARNIDQHITSPSKIDKWFETKTRGMTDLSKAELKRRWGTMQKVVSSEPRAKQIVDDILIDMDTKPRLADRCGNAILVGSSIYQACKFYELFCNAGFKGKCAIVTSYVPSVSDISQEDSGEGKTEKLRQYDIYRRMLADYFGESEDAAMSKVEQFEKEVKEQFVKNPGQMRLLIVVDKLLTGFDAPSATYLYIDKTMSDHGLFQAICRVNRLDGEDKEYGYIVDYRDLFNSLEKAVHDYTTGALDGYDKKDVDGLLTDRISRAREDLDEALERIRALIEPVAPPQGPLQLQHYFCAQEPGNAAQIKANEAKRVDLYKAVSAVVRAYGNLANEMTDAGYTDAEAAAIKAEVAHYIDVRAEVKRAAGEDVDFKQHEAGMRYLLDTYIQASDSEKVSDFEDIGLIDLIVDLGDGAIDLLPKRTKKDPEAVAETIANNMRKVIIDERAMNPKYYDRMSELLDAILEERREHAIGYQEYLDKLLKAAQQLGMRSSDTKYPDWADDHARRALIDFGWPAPDMPIRVDRAIRDSRPHDWVGNPLKEKVVERAIRETLPDDFAGLEDLFKLVKAQREYR